MAATWASQLWYIRSSMSWECFKQWAQMDCPATPKPAPIVWTFFEGYKHTNLLQGPYSHAVIWPVDTNEALTVYFASTYNRAATEIHLREVLVAILPELYKDPAAVNDTLEQLIQLIFKRWPDAQTGWKPEYLMETRAAWSILAELLPLPDVKRAAATLFHES